MMAIPAEATALYDAMVVCVSKGVVMKTMRNAADIVALRRCAAELPATPDRFAALIVLHQLWTPTRMRHFVENYKAGRSLEESVKGVDARPTATGQFEDVNLRAGLIKGQTNEAAITSLVTTHRKELGTVARQLEEQWGDYNFAKLVKIAKQLPRFGNYHSTHLVRSLTYAIPCRAPKMDWKTLTAMSTGVQSMAKMLGPLADGTPSEFAERLSRDARRPLDAGDIALLMCEMKSAGIYKTEDIKVPLSHSINLKLRDHYHRKHGLTVSSTDVCYISAVQLCKYVSTSPPPPFADTDSDSESDDSASDTASEATESESESDTTESDVVV